MFEQEYVIYFLPTVHTVHKYLYNNIMCMFVFMPLFVCVCNIHARGCVFVFSVLGGFQGELYCRILYLDRLAK